MWLSISFYQKATQFFEVLTSFSFLSWTKTKSTSAWSRIKLTAPGPASNTTLKFLIKFPKIICRKKASNWWKVSKMKLDNRNQPLKNTRMNQELENPWQSVLASNVQPGRTANDSRGSRYESQSNWLNFNKSLIWCFHLDQKLKKNKCEGHYLAKLLLEQN